MRFVLSALLATALLGSLATADVRHGQQTAFRLEARHTDQQNGENINLLEHQKASSHKERRNLQQQVAFSAPAVPIAEYQTEHGETDNHHKRAVENEDTELAFHRKISRKRKTRELGQKKKKIEKRDVDKKHSNKKVTKNEDTELAFHRKISRKRKTRELGQKKKTVAKKSLGKKGVNKKLKKNEDTKLAFRRNINGNRKTGELGQKKKKVEKRSIGKKGVDKKLKKNEDTELTFHRKISRKRKMRELAHKKEKAEEEKEPTFKSQDIKHPESTLTNSSV
ncbi:hypothetical protein BGZ67_002278 [Mortierella alpina]|nr:hypothetical protein BGZ67_002278 [Mortierella alpina]